MPLLAATSTRVHQAQAATPCVESARALARWKQSQRKPLMISDWDRTVMLHFAVDPAALQPQIPFPLDTHHGMAYVSLVAFTLRRLRPRGLPAALHPLTRPVSEHGFLNVRTYVRVCKETGIYFLAEWLPNHLSVLLGPPMYGLPYRFGKTDYRHEHENGAWYGRVEPADEDAALQYHGQLTQGPPYLPADADTLDAFLLERYTAFTERKGVRRRFDVWHEPWLQRRAELHIDNDSLLAVTGPWSNAAEHVMSHVSPGVRDVWISSPQRMTDQ